MLEYDIGDREKARQEITVGWIAEGTHASEGNVSRILHVNDIKGMSTSSNSWNIAQIYYGICQHEELFNVFQEVAGEQRPVSLHAREQADSSVKATLDATSSDRSLGTNQAVVAHVCCIAPT